MHDGRVGRRVPVIVVLMIGVVVASCLDHADLPVEPGPGELMDRYVALGNSITAGFQSGGIHLEMQHQAYPVLLAGMAGAQFSVPELAYPGCPPPLAAPLSAERVGPGVCAGRVSPPPPLVQNMAVPGATTEDALSVTGTGTGLDLMILGARSQVEAMLDARPTLVSVWLGNNDALRAALAGDSTLLTPLDRFQSAYDQVVSAIRSTPAQDAILVGVADATTTAPALQPGAYFWGLSRLPDPPIAVQVSERCAPFSADGTPNPGGLDRLVSFQAVFEHLAGGGTGPVTIDCDVGAPFTLDAAEQQAISRRVQEFNAHIRQRAEENGWIYVDPGTALLEPALADPDLVRRCQHLPAAHDEESFFQALLTSCPVPDAPGFFGALFSYDGVHPSAAGHTVIADTLAGRLNARHGLSIR